MKQTSWIKHWFEMLTHKTLSSLKLSLVHQQVTALCRTTEMTGEQFDRQYTYVFFIICNYFKWSLVHFIFIIELKRALGSKVKQKIQIHNQDKDARVLHTILFPVWCFLGCFIFINSFNPHHYARDFLTGSFPVISSLPPIHHLHNTHCFHVSGLHIL